MESKNPIFIRSLEWDIAENWMRKKLEDFSYAEKVYNALCNNIWENVETKEHFHSSWRHSGSIVAENRRYGESYMDFYCSGKEGEVDAEVAKDFAFLGWLCVEEGQPVIKDSDKEDLKDSSKILNEINKDA